MSEKGMRLVAMIEQKEDGKYEVINFLPDITIKHIKDKEFEVIEDKDYIKIPYAQGIDDLTVIVGENGVGKTDLIDKLFQSDNPDYPSQVFTVWQSLSDNSLIKDKGDELIFKNRTVENSMKLFDIASIRYSNTTETIKHKRYDEGFFSLAYLDWEEKHVDLTTTSKLKKDTYFRVQQIDFRNQILFLVGSNFNLSKQFKMLNMDNRKISIAFVWPDFGDLSKQILTPIQNKPILDRESSSHTVLYILNSYLIDYYAYLMSVNSMAYEKVDLPISYLKSLYEDFDGRLADLPKFVEKWLWSEFKESYDKIVETSSNDVVLNENKDIVKYYLFFKKYFEIIDRYSDLRDIETYKNMDFLRVEMSSLWTAIYDVLKNQKLEAQPEVGLYMPRDKSKTLEQLENFSKFFYYSGNRNVLFNGRNRLVSKDHEDIIKFSKFLEDFDPNNLWYYWPDEVLRKVGNFGHFFETLQEIFPKLKAMLEGICFTWDGLSSGEISLLTLFGRLHASALKFKSEKNMMILLDEVDLGLHPEWQRKWINTALPIIGEIFKDKHVQIIMTTHSPIMLSDIYQENVIFLGKDDNGERIVKEGGDLSATFGQNIHDLYRQSFFLGSTRGQYATETINHVIKRLYQLVHWQKEDDRKQEIYEELKWNDFREKILVPSGEDYDEEIVRPLLTIDDFDKYSGVFNNDGDDAKRAYEPLFKILYPTKQLKNNKKNYTKYFIQTFDIIQHIFQKITDEDYQLETIEGLKDIIDEQYKNKKKENFDKIKEKSRKVLVNVSESKFSNYDFRNVLEKVINAIGERLIRNKLLSVFETIDFYLESEVPQSQAADVNELINDLDDGQKRELLEKLRQELERKDNQ